MSATERAARKTWDKADIAKLIELWDRVGSITLLAIILNRSLSSIQTQASRSGLPRREEHTNRHRRRWRMDEEQDLKNSLVRHTDSKGRIRIDLVSKDLNRTVDAIFAKIVDEQGEDAISRLHIPKKILEEMTKAPASVTERRMIDPRTGRPLIVDQRNAAKSRNCLTCTRPFWSEGAHNRVCETCKKASENGGWAD